MSACLTCRRGRMIEAAEIERQSVALGIPFDQMIPFARFGDGRKIDADRPVPMVSSEED